MNKLISSRGLFSIAFLMVIIANIIVLAGVAFNKSGMTAQITLTERELKMPYWADKENSGLSLQLVWRSYPLSSPVWLNYEKLEELGFNLMADYLNSPTYTYFRKESSTKEVFIVLEHNGESYRESVWKAEMDVKEAKDLLNLNLGSGDKCVINDSWPRSCNDDLLQLYFDEAQRRLELERKTESRLFAIDAGINPEILREKYSDKTQFIITKGIVVVGAIHNLQKKENISRYISKLSIEKIYVPLEYRQDLDYKLKRDNYGMRYIHQGYKVELAYGNRYEPWIVAVQTNDDKR